MPERKLHGVEILSVDTTRVSLGEVRPGVNSTKGQTTMVNGHSSMITQQRIRRMPPVVASRCGTFVYKALLRFRVMVELDIGGELDARFVRRKRC